MEKDVITKTTVKVDLDEVIGLTTANSILYILFMFIGFIETFIFRVPCEKAMPIVKTFITKDTFTWLQCGYYREVDLKNIRAVGRKYGFLGRLIGYEELVIEFNTEQKIRLYPVIDTIYFVMSLLLAIKEKAGKKVDAKTV